MGYYSTAELTSAVNLPVPIHTAEWSKALSEKCLVQEHKTVAPSRIEPAGPVDTEFQSTKHWNTASPVLWLIMKSLKTR